MNPPAVQPTDPGAPCLRSGTAARLAGLPVTTLRVWERRYGVVAGVKTESGQRIYSSHDVTRLKLLRHLTQRGHAIGAIAGLAIEPLQALAAGVSTTPDPDRGRRPRVTVVGRGLGQRLAATCDLVDTRDDLDEAQRRTPDGGTPDVLLVRLASLQPADGERVMAVAASCQAARTVVLYGFASRASVHSLRSVGATLRREPVTGTELVQLVRGAAEVPQDAEPGWRVAPRQFSDEALATLADTPSPIACECLRHLAEIVAQLGAFERYSQDCTSASAEDAALHRHLSGMAGAARTQFEGALQRVVAQDRLGP